MMVLINQVAPIDSAIKYAEKLLPYHYDTFVLALILSDVDRIKKSSLFISQPMNSILQRGFVAIGKYKIEGKVVDVYLITDARNFTKSFIYTHFGFGTINSTSVEVDLDV